MTRATSTRIIAATLAAMALLGMSACSKNKKDDSAAPSSVTEPAFTASSTTTSTTKPGSSDTFTNTFKGDTLQWASTATATTSYGSTDDASWSAHQATGAPDVKEPTPEEECGDIGQAWASAARDTVDTLTLGYAKAVIPTGLNIRETYNPDAVVKIVVSGPDGQSKDIYDGRPVKASQCPRYLQVPVLGVDFAINSVAITVDQTQVQQWAEIDAVQLVGNLPSGSGSSTSAPTTTAAVTP